MGGLEGDSDSGSKVVEDDYGFPGSYKQPQLRAELVKPSEFPLQLHNAHRSGWLQTRESLQRVPIHLLSRRPFRNSGSPVLVTQLKSLREF